MVSPRLLIHSRRAKRSAYVASPGLSLVEVLVCLAVTATLIAILLPAIRDARCAARRRECAGKMYTLSVGTTTYGTSWGVMPSMRTTPFKRILCPTFDGWRGVAPGDWQRLIRELKVRCLQCPSDGFCVNTEADIIHQPHGA